MHIRHIHKDTFQVWDYEETVCFYEGSYRSCVEYKRGFE